MKEHIITNDQDQKSKQIITLDYDYDYDVLIIEDQGLQIHEIVKENVTISDLIMVKHSG